MTLKIQAKLSYRQNNKEYQEMITKFRVQTTPKRGGQEAGK